MTAWSEAHLVLVGHGSVSFPEASRPLLQHAERIRDRGLFASVDYGALFGEPSIEKVAQKRRERTTYVVPLLMSEGHYARSVIHRHFAGMRDTPAVVCPPVGVHPRLAEIIAIRALAQLSEQGLAPGTATLLLIAHGSQKNAASFEAAQHQADRLRRMERFGAVRCAFLDQAPDVHVGIARLEGPLVAVGLFAGEGLHATQDLPFALAAYRGGPSIYLGPVGADAAIVEVVLDEVAEAEAARPCAAVG